MSRVGLRLSLARSLALVLSSAAMATAFTGCATEEPGVERTDDDVDESDESSDNENDDEGDKKQEPKKDSGAPASKPKDGGKPPSSTPPDEKPTGDKPTTGGDAGVAVDPGAGGGETTDECEALALVQEKCAGCHDGEGSANTPMGLTSFADFGKDSPKTAGKVHEVSKQRINATGKLMMPPSGLEAADKAVLEKWLSAGAPAGADATCGGDKPTTPVAEQPWPPPGTQCAKLLANGPNATVKKGTEPHPQFIFDAPWGTAKVQALGFKPITDNKKVIHHWILYPNSGGGGGMLTGWAPGGEKGQKPLPDDVGVWMPSGPKSLRLDVHHNNLDGTQDEVDHSGVEVCWTTELRKYEASTFMQFAGIPSIPAGATKDIIGTCTVQADGPVYLMSVSPHAHTLATYMKFDVKKKNGTMVNLYDAPFSFEEQIAKALPEKFLLETGDQVITKCTFKNTTNKSVGFGENTGNEMCFNFATYYPTGKLSCGLGGLPGINLDDLFGGGTGN
jgi:hypothetical protein